MANEHRLQMSAKARRLVVHLLAAADAYAFSGAAHADERPEIEAEYNAAQAKLLAYISKLEEQAAHDPR